MPVGGLAEVAEGEDGDLEIYLRGAVFSLDGTQAIRLSRTGTLADAAEVGRQLANDLLDAGAGNLVAPVPAGSPDDDILGEQP